MSTTAIWLLVVVSIGAVACSPVVYYVPISQSVVAEKVSRFPAKMYVGSIPEGCTYRQLAYVEGMSRSGSPPETIRLMREEATKHGADGMILTGQGAASDPHTDGKVYTGIAVKFTSDGCREGE